MLSEVASILKVTIVGGSIPERSGDKLYNTCCVFGTDGQLKAKHRKVVHFTPLSYTYLVVWLMISLLLKGCLCLIHTSLLIFFSLSYSPQSCTIMVFPISNCKFSLDWEIKRLRSVSLL